MHLLVLAIAIFPCVPADAPRLPFAVIAESYFLIDWISVLFDKKYKAPA